MMKSSRLTRSPIYSSTIKTIKSLPEVSLVTYPMNELARTGAVKAADIRTVPDFEDALRDVRSVGTDEQPRITRRRCLSSLYRATTRRRRVAR